ncbi:hypothetical protein [Catenuloplanes indicus]|uniref:Uncharacterized protein n=1 Tax=Catenuloplanes indicus TaxID=137267 RepID=A0AAE3VU44_9ACTN|nr:hypothetical protein [Catenuloplanes indicus]MDQ0363359.1 hypothetical protein [Catenuloplanes indicus]MDQ0371681.1 hypothetical protein [Catenuloplanes indicus]
MSRTWVTADDGVTRLVEIVADDAIAGYRARCTTHGWLDTNGEHGLNPVIGYAGNHIDYDHREVAA